MATNDTDMDELYRIPDSELIINGDGTIFHLHMSPGQLARKVVLVGDPGRVDLISGLLDSVECSGSSREFRFVTGKYKGTAITILSTGIGSDNIDIVMTELDALANIDFASRTVKPDHTSLEIIRLGTCGAIQPEVPLGAFIFSEVSIGFDGVLNWYAARDKAADIDMQERFVKHMNWNRYLPVPYFAHADAGLADRFRDCAVMGMTVSAAGFYGPQGREVRLGLAMPSMLADLESFSYGGKKILNFEMEGAALAGMSSVLGHKAGTICCAVAHRYLKDTNTDYYPSIRKLAGLVLEKMAG